MNEPVTEREALWDQFLTRWPLDSLAQMTLEQYSQAGSDDYFCRWLEKHTEPLGSIWGGSSFKFGVFSRLDKQEKSSPHHAYTSEHAWLKKYGSSQDEAFATVRHHIVTVALAARAGSLEEIEQIDLGPVVKWKIAFLYQDRKNPSILCVFAARDLCAALGRKADHNEKLAPLQRQLMAQRQGENLFAYSDQVWAKAQDWHRQHSLAEQALNYFEADPERFTVINLTKKLAGFRLNNDRELALLREGGKLGLFVAPGDWQQAIPGLESDPYSRERTRHSGLASCAPALDLGNPALLIKLPDIAKLEAFCLAYESDSMDEVITLQATTHSSEDNAPPLNQILFGPPGTGKTYDTINAALEILDPEALALAGNDRDKIRHRFAELKAEKRIEFVTFHQSFSYEDFVEGLRAVTSSDVDEKGGGIQYEVVPGVFVQLCQQAVRDQQYEREMGVSDEARVWKISIGEVNDTSSRDYCFANGEARIGWDGVGDLHTADLAAPRHNLGQKEQKCLEYFGSVIQEGDILICRGAGTEIAGVGVVSGAYRYEPETPESVRSDYVHVLPVRWLAIRTGVDIRSVNGGVGYSRPTVYSLSRVTWPKLQLALVQAGVALEGPAAESKPGEASKPHVLIIDEINRGNVSRIFGELITLIEPTKRAKASEALEATLPYSKQTFSVPSNVYLIGTMNTADRSLAGLDIALRRRFTFREMAPRPELLDDVYVSGVNIGRLLRLINERIEVLLDRDHCLGHAYFIELKGEGKNTLARLAAIFRQKILPLLQEYFFEDWERIQWVLNDHRKAPADRFVRRKVDAVQVLFGPDVRLPQHAVPWYLNEPAIDRLQAYQGIVSATPTAAAAVRDLQHAEGNVLSEPVMLTDETA